MKKMMKVSAAIVSAIAMMNVANAATTGAYVGGGLGYGNLQTGNPAKSFAIGNAQDATTTPAITSLSNSNTTGGVTGRLFAGYNFNQYFGLEGGYTKYSDAKSKATATTVNSSSTVSIRQSLQTFELVGKGYLPVSDSGFNLYALAGAAYVMASRHNNSTTTGPIGVTAGGKGSTNEFKPVYGVGVSYDVNTQVTTNLEFRHVNGKTNSSVPSANSLTLNAAYNFG